MKRLIALALAGLAALLVQRAREERAWQQGALAGWGAANQRWTAWVLAASGDESGDYGPVPADGRQPDWIH